MTTIEVHLAENIERLLLNRNMTAAELAIKTGVPRSTISAWLHGAKRGEFAPIKIVAGFFELSFDELCFARLRDDHSS